MNKIQKRIRRAELRRKRWIEDLEKIAYHEKGLTMWVQDSEGYKIHFEAIQKILNSKF